MAHLSAKRARAREFAKATILQGKTLKQAYKETVARGDVSEVTLQSSPSKFAKAPMTQEEIARLCKDVDADYIMARLHSLSNRTKREDIELKTLMALGNTRHVSLFENNPTIQNVNAIDLEAIRAKLSAKRKTQAIDNKGVTPAPSDNICYVKEIIPDGEGGGTPPSPPEAGSNIGILPLGESPQSGDSVS